MILGTAGYMSPEQAQGAFGRQAFGHLGLRRRRLGDADGPSLFGGETVTEVIAAVIKDAPDFNALPANTPPGLRRLLERCLERDPKLRLRDIGEARIALTRADEPRDVASPPAGAIGRSCAAAGAGRARHCRRGGYGRLDHETRRASRSRPPFRLAADACRCPELRVRAGWQPDRVHQGRAVVRPRTRLRRGRRSRRRVTQRRRTSSGRTTARPLASPPNRTIRTVPVDRRHTVRRLPDSRIRPDHGGPLAARQHHRVFRVAGERLPRAGDRRHAGAARAARSGDGGRCPFADDGARQSAAPDGAPAWRGGRPASGHCRERPADSAVE